eukprot:TRINITY_DN23201_c0_g1_i1.p1 TRINITY_DN23201_c0_g1~~TRINITY_DN23201_c0_g1_i1.p1  ORF type:complete len:162 (+),score=25.14 TRINITY_DN23201_c0_g1_i1:220-705(+)
MADTIGIIKVRIVRGRNLAIRDTAASDPYVVVTLGSQSVKTTAIKRDLNPYWDEELRVAVPERCPPLKVQIFDKDTFTKDDPLGYAEVDLERLIAAAKVYEGRHARTNDEEIGRVRASDKNGFVSDSVLLLTKVGVKQVLQLKLKGVESGEIEIELHWVDA